MLKCEICGKEIECSLFASVILCSNNDCYEKYYWLERVKRKDSPTQVVINGIVYQIGREDDCSSFRGYDGRQFKIKFFDGRIVTTTNLWHNGKVPAEFRDRLPDNAEWYKGE